MANARVRRGRRTQNVCVACWLRDHGWHDAIGVAAGLPGKDILNVEGHAISVAQAEH